MDLWPLRNQKCGLTDNLTVPDMHRECGHEQFARRLRHCIGLCAGPVRNREIAMLSLNVVPREERPLTDQIVMGVKRQIDDRQLRPGDSGCRRSAISRKPTVSADSPSSKLMIGSSRWVVYNRAEAPASMLQRRGPRRTFRARPDGAPAQ